jgi:YidC/Oxa1 family membrane protein insertase
MEKRLFLAMILTALVLVVVPRFFSSPPAAPRRLGNDTSQVTRATGPDSTNGRVTRVDSGTAVNPVPGGNNPPPIAAPGVAAETTLISTSTTRYRFTNNGARLSGAELTQYRALTRTGGDVELARAGEPLLRYRLAFPQDTVSLDEVTFRAEQTDGALTYRAAVRDAELAITYAVASDPYVIRVSGTVEGGATPASILVDLPRGVRSEEADTVEDQRHLAYAYKPVTGNAKSISFKSLDPGEQMRYSGPLTWVVAKNKYFLLGLLTPVGDAPFQNLVAVGGPRTSKAATMASASTVEPITDGHFAFEIYAGPQDSRRLVAMGRDFKNANPYGGWLQGVVQPFATIVMQILLWFHDTFKLNYGWVLVIFGITVRIALWPLNQRAMRSSLRMQQIQPQLMEVQKKYQDNPEKQRAELMRVYKEHDMTPFSPMVGCLPMLLPMPILFALFFVFQNTIEFRGVSFLWLPDISLKDPFYIVPVLMGLSMFVLSWIGIRNAPPNPQAKVMAYFFPVMMTVFFLNFASGLNLYYAVQNLAALPQQWLIANERAKVSSLKRA